MGLFSQPSYPNPQNVTATPQLTPEQQKLQSTAAQFLTSQVGQPAPAYTGPFTAALTPQQEAQISGMGAGAAASYAPEQAGLAGLGAGAAGSGATQGAGLGALGSYAAGNYIPGMGGPGDAFLRNVLGTTAGAAEQQFAGAIPTIRGPFVASGQTGFSSPEEAALGGAAAQFATGLQSNLANQALGQYTTEQQMQLAAAQPAVQDPLAIQQAAATIPATIQAAALGAAGLPQQTQQQQLTAQYQDWLRQIGGAWQAAGVPAFSTLAAQTGYQAQYPNVYGQSPFQSVLGGLTSLAGPAATYFGSPYR